MQDKFLNKSMQEWEAAFPLLKDMRLLKEVYWVNPKLNTFDKAMEALTISEADVKEAEERLQRFAPYIMSVFPETTQTGGIIESPVARLSDMKAWIENHTKTSIDGDLLLKCDSHLAISGSIKARGGIYEVLKHAEDLVLSAGLVTPDMDYSAFDSEEVRRFLSGYTVAVGSTGNLGLSIGIMSAKLGFKVFVHMSADAKAWKKNLLRSKGVTVVEYDSDYSKAVEEGRRQSDADPNSYFVDDENSKNLFMGYAVAASRLRKQFDDMGVTVDQDHPLFVYLPCGVGGGPGGVAFGLKLAFKDSVHCFFAEPTHAPCMLLGMMTGLQDKVSVQDFGIDNMTEADGLAVGRPSGFVGTTLNELLSGDFTVDDSKLFVYLKALADTEDIFMEPSAFAGMAGIAEFLASEVGKAYIKAQGLEDKMKSASHLAWGTGGSMVPKEEMKAYYERGARL